jgi:hypothetical protein
LRLKPNIETELELEGLAAPINICQNDANYAALWWFTLST